MPANSFTQSEQRRSPRTRLRLDIVLNNLAAWAVTTGSIRLLSDGSAWRPLVHVRDVARVTDVLLRAPDELVRKALALR